jgi:hypothetical protein
MLQFPCSIFSTSSFLRLIYYCILLHLCFHRFMEPLYQSGNVWRTGGCRIGVRWYLFIKSFFSFDFILIKVCFSGLRPLQEVLSMKRVFYHKIVSGKLIIIYCIFWTCVCYVIIFSVRYLNAARKLKLHGTH